MTKAEIRREQNRIAARKRRERNRVISKEHEQFKYNIVLLETELDKKRKYIYTLEQLVKERREIVNISKQDIVHIKEKLSKITFGSSSFECKIQSLFDDTERIMSYLKSKD